MYELTNTTRRVIASSIAGVPLLYLLFLSIDHFCEELCIRAITLTPYRQSGNWVAVVVSIALVLIPQVLRWRRAKWKLRAMGMAWKANLRDTVLSALIVGTGLFVYSLQLEIRKINMDARKLSAPKIQAPQAPSFAWDSSPRVTIKPLYPYNVQVESVVATPAPRSSKVGTGFWVAYIADGVKTLSPARMLVYLRITNLQDHPAMITRYSVRMGKIKMIKISGPPTEAFYDGHGDIHHVCWVDASDILDKNLDGVSLEPKKSVQGIGLFDWPEEFNPKSLQESELMAMRFTVTINDAEGHSFSSKPLEIQADPSNESVQSRVSAFNRGMRDLSAFTIKDFTAARGFSSPPF